MTIFISIISVLIFLSVSEENDLEKNDDIIFSDNSTYYFSNSNFFWPLPGFHRITSPFGKRVSPTTGASSSHSGIDIPAPQGTKFVAVNDGIITFRQFLGAGGYTITLSFDNYKISYCHCDPNFIVEVGQKVEQGEVIRKSGT